MLSAEFGEPVPFLAIGAAVDTMLMAPNGQNRQKVSGHLVSHAITDAGAICSIAYGAEEAGRVRALSCTRSALRIKPSPALPLSASVDRGPLVQVYDISTDGIGLLGNECEQARIGMRDLCLRIRVPGHTAEVGLYGDVRVRSLLGSTVLFGIAFNAQRTPLFAKKQEVIHEYVMRRQAEALRERAQRLG